MKKLALTLSLLIMPTIALAQQQLPAEVNLKLAGKEVELVWKGLRKLPLEDVEFLLPKIQQQVAEQSQPPKPVEEPKKE